PSRASARLMTMSTSSAPSATARAASAALISLWWAPDGNPHTVATTRPSAFSSGSCEGETHTARTPSSWASATSAATCSRVASGLSRVWSISWATSARVVMCSSWGCGGSSLSASLLLAVILRLVQLGHLDGLLQLVGLRGLPVEVDDLRRVVVLPRLGVEGGHGLLGVLRQVGVGRGVRRDAHRHPSFWLFGGSPVWPVERLGARVRQAPAAAPRSRGSTRRAPGAARCGR